MPTVQPGAQQPAAGVGHPVQSVPVGSKDNKTIMIAAIVILALTTVAFAGLFIWALMQYNTVSTDVDGQINAAVAKAVEEQAKKDEEEFAEREKHPYRTFSGPADYGQLTFEYPNTWSLYIASDASHGGNYEAYFNPIEVNAISGNNIYALRLTIFDEAFENVTKRYSGSVGSDLKLDVITIGDTTANRYSGKIPSTDYQGYIVVFKIRDKTAVLRTDSLLFAEDFDELLETISFNA